MFPLTSQDLIPLDAEYLLGPCAVEGSSLWVPPVSLVLCLVLAGLHRDNAPCISDHYSSYSLSCLIPGGLHPRCCSHGVWLGSQWNPDGSQWILMEIYLGLQTSGSLALLNQQPLTSVTVSDLSLNHLLVHVETFENSGIFQVTWQQREILNSE